MKIGITYDLKVAADGLVPPDLPDDFQEEFDSPETIEALAGVLGTLGHHVTFLGDGPRLVERVVEHRPDFVFNYAEGLGVSRSREARVPALLETLDIPYSGSDPFAMVVTLDKDCAKRLVASVGVEVPKWDVIRDLDQLDAVVLSELPLPLLVKPVWEGSSKGIRSKSLVHRAKDLREVVSWLLGEQQQPVMVEEYIEGDEVTVGLLGNDPARLHGMMRISPVEPTEHFVYSLEVKRDFRRLVHYESPAPLPQVTCNAIEKAAVAVNEVLGCRDVVRIDFRVRDGIPYFIEANPVPGLHPEDSDLVIMSHLMGWSHAQLIETILQASFERTGLVPTSENRTQRHPTSKRPSKRRQPVQSRV